MGGMEIHGLEDYFDLEDVEICCNVIKRKEEGVSEQSEHIAGNSKNRLCKYMVEKDDPAILIKNFLLCLIDSLRSRTYTIWHFCIGILYHLYVI